MIGWHKEESYSRINLNGDIIMRRKIYFDLFSTAWFNEEPFDADKEKMLCPLATVVQRQG